MKSDAIVLKKWIYCGLLFLGSGACNLLAQVPELSFHNFGIENKLASNYVNCILCDSKGYLWFGTNEGLNRFDGYEFKLFRHSVSDSTTLGGNFITSLLEDHHGNIWVGTSQDGLSIINQHLNTVQRYRFGNQKTDLPNDYIGCIYEDKQRNIWIGTYNGLCRFDSVNRIFITYKHNNNTTSLSDDAIICMNEDNAGNFWVGTSYGLNIFNKKTGCCKRIFHSHENANSIASNFLRYILQDKDGNIWFGTDNAGISKLNLTTGIYKQYQHNSNPNSLGDNQVWCLFQDSKQNIWVGTINGGLNLYNPQTDNFTKYIYSKNISSSIPSNSVTSIIEDHLGNLWFTTHGGGIAYKNSGDEAFEHFMAQPNNSGSLSNKIVKCFFEDAKGRIWIGTDGGGLNLFDRKTGKFKSFRTENGLSSNVIMDICQADNNHLWLATWKGGICRFNSENYSTELFLNIPDDKYSLNNNNVEGLLLMPDGKLWVATHGGGINIYNPSTHQFINQNNHPEYNLIGPCWGTSLLKDKGDTIWVTTYAGLFKIKDFKIKGYPHDNNNNHSLSGYYVYTAFQDKSNKLWFATNNGLDLYNPSNQDFTNISDMLGFTGNVKSVLDDTDGNIWFTMDNKLIKIKKGDSCNVYNDFQHGQFSEKACLRSSNGDLFFGSTDGFVIVHPKKIEYNNFPLPVYIKDFQLFNVSQKPGSKNSILHCDISETSEITLKHSQSSVSFGFVALNYTSPYSTTYAYKLEGFDKDWIMAGENRKATFTNLNPGTYTFKVKAANNYGVWNNTGASVRIIIKPPFWLTIWAYGIYLCVLILALIAYRRLILFKERLRAEVEKERELDALKTQFFTNVSHEFRTPLTLILGPAESLLKAQDINSNETQVGQIKLILRNAQRLLRLVNQLLDFSKIEAGKTDLELKPSDIIGFIKYVLEPFNTMFSEKTILINTKFHEPSQILWFDADKMEKVITNLISNAIKNTLENGNITLVTSVNNGYFEIEIADTGIGIAQHDLNLIFERFYQAGTQAKLKGTGIGLALTKEYIDLHKGSISVRSEIGNGTTFIIQLPLLNVPLTNPEIIDSSLSTEESQTGFEKKTQVKSDIITNQLPLLLVIDDNADIRSYIHSSLQSYYNIEEAQNGMEGMEMAAEFMPDIIISDVMMPVSNGMDFCRLVKSDRRTSHIPVILLTAKTSDASKIEGFETGADDYLVKPFNIDVLNARLKNLLEGRNRLKELYKKDITLEPEKFTNNSIDNDLVKRIYEIVEINISDPDFNPDILAYELLMSRSSLYSKIKAISGESVSIFVRNIRLKKAAELILQNKLTISQISFQVGFNNIQYFSKCFKEAFGKKPSEFR